MIIIGSIFLSCLYLDYIIILTPHMDQSEFVYLFQLYIGERRCISFASQINNCVVLIPCLQVKQSHSIEYLNSTVESTALNP